MSNSDFHRCLQELEIIPEKVAEALKTNDMAKAIAAIYKDATNCLYLGRGYNFPVALEGALKLKEISYIHMKKSDPIDTNNQLIHKIDFEVEKILDKRILNKRVKLNFL